MMAQAMKKVAEMALPLKWVELRDLHTAYRNWLRPIRRIHDRLADKALEKEGFDARMKVEEVREAEAEKIHAVAKEVVDLLDHHVLPRLPADDFEGRVLALRMRADHLRYVAVCYWGAEKWTAEEAAGQTYSAALALAKGSLPPTNPT